MSLPREFLFELHKNFTGDIRTDAATRILYSTDASIYQMEPLGVVIPRNQEELHAAVDLAIKYRIPILPRGAGTSLAGQAVGEALILDCSRWLDKILEINAEEHYAIVEPGVVLADLNRAAAKHGLMYGPDPASAERATMGGVIANDATGAHSIIYGMSADHILAADVIVGDGSFATFDDSTFNTRSSNHQLSKIVAVAREIRQTYADAIKQKYPKTWRNSVGYRLNYLLPWSPSKPPQWIGDTYLASLKPDTWNLAPLLAGSEGTLAVIRRMKVNLVPKPRHTILAVLAYESVAEACDDVPRLLEHDPSAVELIPRAILKAARSSPGYARQMSWLSGDPAAMLVVEFSGDDPQTILKLANGVGTVFVIAQTKEDQARVWNVRRVGLGLMDSKPQSARPIAFIEDCAIPVEQLGEFVRDVERILSAHDVEGHMYAHASAGCLHIRPLLDLKSGRDLANLRAISEEVFELTVSLGGAMSSEHGDGLARSEYVERAYGSELLHAMRLLKNAADPHGLFNPGKILNAPKMDTNLRYYDTYQGRAWKTNLSFAHQGGYDLAVEQCNGQGLCRKTSGVMCPSYQATREEMHSTRGRANLLRAAISGQQLAFSGQNAEVMEATFEALDLCLACKGCKAECPSGVDMAKLKYEFENEYYKSHPRPLRDYLFGYFDQVAKLLSPVAPLANAVMNFPLTRKLIAKSLGLASERPLPRFARESMSLRAKRSNLLLKRNQPESKKDASTKPGSQRHLVIYLPDVFSRYIEPQVEQAALEVLAMCGYDVRVLPIVGAGASLYSKGFIEAARRHAEKTLEMLNQLDPKSEAIIVGLEPPEIYLLKNEYVDLIPNREEEIKQRAANVWLMDEFLVRSPEFDTLRVARLGTLDRVENGTRLPGPNDKLFFHPHCHQRAEGPSPDGRASGAQASVELLRACGFDAELSDAGCCGMAGTFGYEAEHYDLSMQIGGLKLFPKIRESIFENRERESDDRISNVEYQVWNVASTGAACRMQIKHGTGLTAYHPIELVRERLG